MSAYMVRGERGAYDGRSPNLIRALLPLIGLCLLLSLSLGCRKKVAASPTASIQKAAPPPAIAPPAITPSVISPSKPAPPECVPEPKVVAAPSSLELGISRFKSRDYGKAEQLFEDYIQNGSNSENVDFALFHLFLARKLAANTGKSARRAEEALRQIIAEFPKSPYKAAAEWILGLQAQIESLRADNKEKEAKIKQLSEELQKLKEIDLQRRPSRPLY